MKTTVLIFSLLCMLTIPAKAEDIVSVNFNRWQNAAVDVPEGYGVEPANNWFMLHETADPPRQGTDLMTSTGETSTIGFTVSGGGWERFAWSDDNPWLYTPMGSGFAVYGDLTLTISGIDGTFPNEYDVIVYVTGWGGAGAYTDGTTTYYCQVYQTADLIRSTDMDDSDGVDQGTYVRFNNLSADTATIQIMNSTGAGIGGFQIVGADRGAAYALSPSGVVNKDFDANELTWISGDVPDDPNLTVTSFDLYYYSKPVADVTDDDPNFANPSNTVTSIVDATSPTALTFDYETAYFWYVDSNVEWDSIDITGNLTETISSRISTFEVEPSQVPPKVYILPDGAHTWLDEMVLVPVMVLEKDFFTYDWEVTGPDGYQGNPNDFLINKTLVDMGDGIWEATAEFNVSGADPELIGWYEITLTATDTVPTSGSDTMWIQVSETACDTYLEAGGSLNVFDANADCKITLEDLIVWAEAWLDDRRPSEPYIYTP